MSTAARRQLRRLSPDAVLRIQRSLTRLSGNPRLVGSVKMKGNNPFWRIRAGRYRIIYEIVDSRQIVSVARVSLRNKSTYRNL
ncbi:MAG: type II toxin-antitoxin system RelE/ParE family toxin [Chloroflexi bacterium]|nr:type II toxin-antitoxin system RelE/ParE family toxin [Chloroflexota bacterium]